LDFRAGIMPIRRATITIRMGTTCGRITLILNYTRIITRAAHTTGITGTGFTATIVIIITTIKLT
jgi:hypothetical protein